MVQGGLCVEITNRRACGSRGARDARQGGRLLRSSIERRRTGGSVQPRWTGRLGTCRVVTEPGAAEDRDCDDCRHPAGCSPARGRTLSHAGPSLLVRHASDGGDGGIRTLTAGGLSALPLPVGLRPLPTVLPGVQGRLHSRRRARTRTLGARLPQRGLPAEPAGAEGPPFPPHPAPVGLPGHSTSLRALRARWRGSLCVRDRSAHARCAAAR